MKLFKILVLSAVLTFVLSNCKDKKGFLYEVEAKNGGPNGFKHAVCNCNTYTNKYKEKYSDPGYEKRQNCCEDDLPKDVLKLTKMCEDLISQDMDTSGISILSGYNLTFAIKDKFNFRYSISK